MNIRGLIWLRSVVEKLAAKHRLSPEECEEVFANTPHFRKMARGNIAGEDLYAAMGRTQAGRYVVVFFVHKFTDEALVISGRDLTAAERRLYERG